MRPDVRWLAAAAVWLAMIQIADAHPPHVDGWMHTANAIVSAIIGIGIAIQARKTMGLTAAIAIGAILGMACSVLGWLISIAVSM